MFGLRPHSNLVQCEVAVRNMPGFGIARGDRTAVMWPKRKVSQKLLYPKVYFKKATGYVRFIGLSISNDFPTAIHACLPITACRQDKWRITILISTWSRQDQSRQDCKEKLIYLEVLVILFVWISLVQAFWRSLPKRLSTHSVSKILKSPPQHRNLVPKGSSRVPCCEVPWCSKTWRASQCLCTSKAKGKLVGTTYVCMCRWDVDIQMWSLNIQLLT